MLKSFDDHQGDVPRNEKPKRSKDQEAKRQERNKKRKVTGEESRCRKMVKNRFGVVQKTKTSKREVVVMCVKFWMKMESSAVTLSVCLYLVHLTTHTGTLLSTLCGGFFLPAFLQKSLRTDSERLFDRAAATKWMPQEWTRCGAFSRFWAVRLLRQSLLPSGAGRRSLRLWERRENRLELSPRVEDWSTAAAPGWVPRMRVAGAKGDIGQMSVAKLVTYSRGWCPAQMKCWWLCDTKAVNPPDPSNIDG